MFSDTKSTSGGAAPDVGLQDVWQLLELAAIHHADKLAVIDCAAGSGGRQLTYSQLFDRAAALAAHLAAAGVRRGDRIGVLSRNAAHVIELHFAAAAIHAVVVNLNIHLAPRELAFICADSEPRLVFADTHCAAALLAAHAQLRSQGAAAKAGTKRPVFDNVVWMRLEGNGALPAEVEGLQNAEYEACLAGAAAGDAHGQLSRLVADVLAEGSEEDGFHLYYTSGTTGVPKGVLLSHKIVVHHAVGTVKEMGLHRGDVWGHFAPMFHLVDVFAVYAVTLVGGRHVTLPTFTPQDALLAIERERVSATNVASTMVAMLVNNPLVEQLDLTSLRVLSCGGSPQSPAVVKRAIAVFGCEFFLSYGMTECCGKISMSILPRKHVVQSVPVEDQLALVTSSGRPFLLVDVRVVDEEGIDVAKNGQQVGEVWVRGPTVFSGYFGVPAATAESFAEGEWFKTGDLATAGPNGYIQVVDRKKDMLLVGGENVYTTEVEAVLESHPGVHQAAVFGVPSRVMGELVGAAVTLRPEVTAQATSSKELIEWCSTRLAHYKVPAAVHILPRMPTTGSGKILKTELRNIFGGSSSGKTSGGAAPAAPGPMTVSLAEAAAVLAAACGGDLSCQPLDDGLGVEWGRELLPDLTYLLLVEQADDLQGQASHANTHSVLHCSFTHAGLHLHRASARALMFTFTVLLLQIEVAAGGKGLKNVAVVTFERPAPQQLANLAAEGARVVVLHVERAACAAAVALSSTTPGSSQLRTALATLRELLPPFAGVLHAPVAPTEAAAAASAVEAALAVAAGKGAELAAAVVPDVPAPGVVLQPAKTSTDVASMRRAIVAALGSLLGEEAGAGISGDEPRELPGTLVFDYPSINEMAAFLSAKLLGGSAASEPTVAPPAAAVTAVATPPRAARPSRAAPAATAASKSQLEAAGAALVLQQLAQLLGGSTGGVAADAPLMSAGLTSTLAVQLTQLLEEAVGAELQGTLVFDYPSAAEIGAFLAAEGLVQSGTVETASAARPLAAPAAAPQLEQLGQVVALVLREASNLLGGDASINAQAPLMSAGLTSTLAVQLVAALEGVVGAELPGTLVFDYPSRLRWTAGGGRRSDAKF
ncbi:4-hydroxybutyrate--CoA ligase 2 [Chlorella vulgaris]